MRLSPLATLPTGMIGQHPCWKLARASLFAKKLGVLFGQPVHHQGHHDRDGQGPGPELVAASGNDCGGHHCPIDARRAAPRALGSRTFVGGFKCFVWRIRHYEFDHRSEPSASITFNERVSPSAETMPHSETRAAAAAAGNDRVNLDARTAWKTLAP